MFDESEQVVQLPEASGLAVRRGGKGEVRWVVTVGVWETGEPLPAPCYTRFSSEDQTPREIWGDVIQKAPVHLLPGRPKDSTRGLGRKTWVLCLGRGVWYSPMLSSVLQHEAGAEWTSETLKGTSRYRMDGRSGREIVRRTPLCMGMMRNAPVTHVVQSLKSAVDGGLLRM